MKILSLQSFNQRNHSSDKTGSFVHSAQRAIGYTAQVADLRQQVYEQLIKNIV